MKLQRGRAEGHLHESGRARGPATSTLPARGTGTGTGTDPASGTCPGPDQVLGRYRLESILGRGSAAVVYRGYDMEQHRPVALKVFSEPAGDPALQARHRSEASLLAQVRHDAVVQLLGRGTDAGHADVEHHYIALELVEGPDLRELIGKAPPTAEQTIRWGFDLLGALGHIHRLGIVHRDIKPANVLVDSNRPGGRNQAKLTDFGSAAYGNAVSPGFSLGTAQYTSPEQARESSAGPASDIYSLGLVLIECLTGKPAFTGIPLATMVARTLRRPQVPAGIPPRLSALLRSMTAVEAGHRPEADAAAHALAGV